MTLCSTNKKEYPEWLGTSTVTLLRHPLHQPHSSLSTCSQAVQEPEEGRKEGWARVPDNQDAKRCNKSSWKPTLFSALASLSYVVQGSHCVILFLNGISDAITTVCNMTLTVYLCLMAPNLPQYKREVNMKYY